MYGMKDGDSKAQTIYYIFQGMEVHGIADYVICHGRVVVEEGNVRAVSGMGKFVPTPSHSPHVYGRVQERDIANAPQKVLFVSAYS